MSTLDKLYSSLIAADDMFIPRGPYHLVREDTRWAQPSAPERRRCAYCASNHTEDRCRN